ncbi:hypothetical protein KAU11_07080 [Candidatus Babeliales bacterium]|nr:hypothetical protein [Candidatus Babeliales bacterium]
MDVYVVERHFDWEGFDIVGLYKTEEEAQEAMRIDDATFCSDSLRIEVFDLAD